MDIAVAILTGSKVQQRRKCYTHHKSVRARQPTAWNLTPRHRRRVSRHSAEPTFVFSGNLSPAAEPRVSTPDYRLTHKKSVKRIRMQ